jgi:HTH-type transcriptional regulator/antitoxin HipB
MRSAQLHRGLNQREFAEELSVTQRYIIEIEHGKPTKAIERLFDFMRETGVVLYADVSNN